MITHRAIALIVPLTLGVCVTNPVTGKSELALVSRQSEISIGTEQYLPAQQSQAGLYQVDTHLTAYVQQIGSRLAAVRDTELPYEFVVLNNSSPNAWALPGGKIAINRGLLTTLDSEAELAAVLEPNKPRFYGLKADMQHTEGTYHDALRSYDSALKRDDNYYQYYLGRGLTRSKLGNDGKARADLERSNQLLPTSVATNELGTLSLQRGDRDCAKRYFAAVDSGEGALSKTATDNYIRLDIADNPTDYIQAQPAARNRTLAAIIHNTTGIPIQSAVVQFTAVINGQRTKKNSILGTVQANSRTSTSSGWHFRPDDAVGSVTARVISIRL